MIKSWIDAAFAYNTSKFNKQKKHHNGAYSFFNLFLSSIRQLPRFNTIADIVTQGIIEQDTILWDNANAFYAILIICRLSKQANLLRSEVC